jgi:hypothetical protein
VGNWKKINPKKGIINQEPKIPFECPSCHWIHRSEKPNAKNPIPSVKKPKKNNVIGNIIVEKHVCRNPRCQKQVNVFWFKPRDFYNKI